jgi:hypothetical protein
MDIERRISARNPPRVRESAFSLLDDLQFSLVAPKVSLEAIRAVRMTQMYSPGDMAVQELTDSRWNGCPVTVRPRHPGAVGAAPHDLS